MAEGRKPSPTAAILDCQSVKGAEQGGKTVGFDAGKKIGRRKRRVLVDTCGMILGVCVTSAAVQDRDGAVFEVSLRDEPTPQAKGKIERLHDFWQKRLTSAFAADAITSIAPANALIDQLRVHRSE